MEQNPELALAWQFIENTGTHLFLTGKAGTGKTTFLHRLKAESPKRMVVLAPTGIAAINAGGVTIHSFFQLPLAPHVPDSSFQVGEKSSRLFRFSREKLNIIRSMDLLVIDEISMVRADLLDAVDQVLRRFRDRYKPFGGVQLLMIGDLQQLAPVVKDDEWSLLKAYYDTPYFFSSRALKRTEYCVIELTRVYRQTDTRFLDLLNSIRDNRADKHVLQALNSRYLPDFQPPEGGGYIRLVTHNYQAQNINEFELQSLPGRSYTFRAVIDGKFPDYAYPTESLLELKAGAQVMFVKNDSSGNHRYYNGMIGEVTNIAAGHIEVRSRDTGQVFVVPHEVWNNSKYALDEETKAITEEVEGTFKQYPLKLAWAITIHKSQGLTFEHAIIDVSESFAHGQAYVALSRCKTLEGLVLSKPITEDAIITDETVEDFTDEARRQTPDANRLHSLQQAYYYDLLNGLFDFLPFERALHRYVRLIDEYLYKLYPGQLAMFKEKETQFHQQVTEVALRFHQQYTRLMNMAADYTTDEVLQDRIRRGADYFLEKLLPWITLLNGTMLATDNKEVKKKLLEADTELKHLLRHKVLLLKYVSHEGFHTASYLKQKAVLSIEPESSKLKEPKAKSQAGRLAVPATSSDVLHPVLYRQLVDWRREEASKKELPVYMIIQQKALLGIANLLPSDREALARIPYLGRRGIEKYGDAILTMVNAYKRRYKE